MTNATMRLMALLQVRSNETRLVGLVTAIMLSASMGGAIGSPGVEALFYARFGVQYLPNMYIVLGLVTLTTSLLMTGLLARTRRDRLGVVMPLFMALLLASARLLLVLQFNWFYPVLWLGMNLFWVLQGLFTWGLAGLVCDTRQAKRLFPLFGVGGIVGLTIGSLLTGPIVELIGTENLILVWAGGLLLAFGLAQRLVSTTRIQLPERYGPRPRLLNELEDGFRYVRASALLRWMSLAAVLFAILWYALVFPFAQAAAAQFPNESDLAAFLGTFQGIASGAAVLVSLLVANRLYLTFGFMATILVYPILYLLGFASVAISASFAALVAFRFAQILWSEGVSEGANQAMFNVVPPEQREKARTFIRGVANQLGISLAGVMLLLSERALTTQVVFIIGAVAAALTVYLVWRARGAYGSAVVAALRAGQSHLFFSDERPFGGFRQDATAVSTVLQALHSPDVTARRVAAEILSHVSLPEGTGQAVAALDDPDASVRAALLRALARSKASEALLEVTAHLSDPDPEVRLQALLTVRQLTDYPKGLAQHVEPLLDDPDPGVRSRAAVTLLKLGPHPRAAEILKRLATAGPETGGEAGETIAGQIQALEALVEWGSPEAYDIAAAGLRDPSPAVRRASAAIIASIDAEQCLFPLRAALGDEDATVRQAVAKALGQIGDPALEMTVSALKNPRLEDGALLALEYLPARRAAAEIQTYEAQQVADALRYHALWRAFAVAAPERAPFGEGHDLGLERRQLLADVLQDKARHLGRYALRAMAVLGDTISIRLAIDNLASADPNQRANAVETLDSLGDPAVVRPLLALWEPGEARPAPARADGLLTILSDDDPWLRASAVMAMGSSDDPAVIAKLTSLAETDPDPIVRETAQLAVNGDTPMETMQTLSTMERILFLRRVPLFAGLPTNDLKQLASVAGEMHFSDGSLIGRQGERGDIMYMIVEGEVLVTVAAEDGPPVVISKRGPGEYVGEMAIISDEVRMASLTAVGAVRTLFINQRQFMELIRTRPETSVAVMRVLCDRLREREMAQVQALMAG